MSKKLQKIWLILITFIMLLAISGCKPSITVTFDAGMGTFNSTEYVGKKGETILNFDYLTPTLDGYDFVGWFEKESDIKWTKDTKLSKDVTLVAKYKENGPVRIVYELDGGVNNPGNPERYVDGFVLLEPKKEGYLFDYWTYNDQIVTVIPNVSDNPIVLVAHFTEEKTKLVYELDGGTNNSENPERYVPGFELLDPIKPGYTFEYWEYNGEQITSIPEVTDKVLTITAHYTINEYTIEYELDGGINDERNVITFTINDLPITLYDPQFEGKSFLGWYIDGRRVLSIPNNPSTYCKNLVITARFETYYNIRYEGEGLDTVDNPTTYVSSKGLILNSPTKPGYVFAGWNWNGYIVNSIPAGTTGDIVLTTIFDLATYTIKYELDGGINNSRNPSSYTIEDRNIVLGNPTKDNHNFLGWLLDGEIVKYIDVNLAKDIVLVASWEVKPTYHVIIYEMNGGITDGPCEPRYIEGIGCKLPNITKEGYTFKGWNTNEDGTGEFLTEISATSTKDYHLYAIWEKDEVTRKLDFELNGGQCVNLPTSYIEGVGLNLPTPIKDGYTFVGWYATNDFRGQSIRQISKEAIGDLVLYAKYSSNIEIYSITYHLNGGIFISETPITEFTKDTETFTLPLLTRDGYEFYGWEDEDGNTIESIVKGTQNDVVVRAIFTTSDRTYTIKYISDGGKISESVIYNYKGNEKVVLPSATKEGTMFIGWHKLPNLSDDPITVIENTSANIVLYAEYENIVYTITYVSDGAHSNPETYTIEDGTIYLDPAEKEGYEFIGWYTREGQLVSTIDSDMLCDIYLIGKFEAIVEDGNMHTVTFVNYDGTTLLTKQVTHGTKVSELIIGEVNGLALSWYLHDLLYDFDELVTEDIVLEAKWSVIDEIFAQVFTTSIIERNVKVSREYDTSAGTIMVRWSSDLYEILNMVTGVINQEYTDTIVEVTGEFVLGNQSFNVKRNIIVGKVQFKELTNHKPVIGYFYSRTASCEITDVTKNTLDIINYGFGTLRSDFTIDISELRSIERMISLRQDGIRVLLCLGGYGAAGTNYSKAASTAAGRKKFANSILELLIKYHFDGVDIDWEYPGYETGTDVAIDRPNYTLLIQEVRDTLKAYNPEYLITAAIPGGKYGYTRYELNKVGQILDYVNLMTYDLQQSNLSTHHTGLYTGPYTPHGSIEQTVEIFSLRGVPKSKQIVGLAFYGRQFNVKSDGDGIGCASSSSDASAITYSNIYKMYLEPIKNGSQTIKRYWDDTTKAPYIYDSKTGVWISYDDPESIKYKCEFVLENNYGGVMFWDYGEDDTLQLIQAIHDNFR